MNTQPEPTRQEMIEFLSNHCRYHTMNSWNNATSYARNVKIYNMGLTREQESRAYEIIYAEGAFDGINQILREFDIAHRYEFQMAFNGRSGGYIVLIPGGKKDAGYKTQCDTCGKLTYYETEQLCKMDGCEGTLEFLKSPTFQIFTQPGKGVDMDADFEEWDDYCLEARYKLIKEFDATVDECIEVFKALCDSCKAVEKTIMVPKTITVLECAGASA
jgi:hypothetical protein